MTRRGWSWLAATLAIIITATVGAPAAAGPAREPAHQTGRVWFWADGGQQHTCGIRLARSLWCWGHNRSGQLGLGDRDNRVVPTRVGRADDWVWVSASPGGVADGAHTCGIRADRSLWCWGHNRSGQLGLGDTGRRFAPTLVGGGADWNRVYTGGDHSCAVQQDRSLWCWGKNDFGQLGLGDTRRRLVPTRVGSGVDWVRVYAGGDHNCGNRADGSLWCWGANDSGQLGLGDTTDRSVPTQVGVDVDWTEMVSAGRGHTCGVRLDHSLWCWGNNSYGALGLGDTTDRSAPTQVGTDWTHRSLGGFHTCATRTDQSMWCWGYNRHGQLGLGDESDRLVPTRLGTDAAWVRVSAGADHTCAIRKNHSLWCWGKNTNGQLGVGDTNDRTVPTRV